MRAVGATGPVVKLIANRASWALLGLQILNSSLLLFPLTVWLVTVREDRQPTVLATTLSLVGISTILLSTFLIIGVLALGRSDISVVVRKRGERLYSQL